MPTTDLPRTRDGRFQVTESRWDSDRPFHVTIIDTRASSPGEVVPPDVIERERRTVRELARRVDPMDRIRWVRTDGICVVRTPEDPRVQYRLTVSRLERMYR